MEVEAAPSASVRFPGQKLTLILASAYTEIGPKQLFPARGNRVSEGARRYRPSRLSREQRSSLAFLSFVLGN
jgi:hypothetical protein